MTMKLLLDGKPLESTETNTAENVANGVLRAAGELAALLDGRPGKLAVSGIDGYPAVKVTVEIAAGEQTQKKGKE